MKEEIKLELVTPETKLPQFDAAISKLKEIDALMNKIGADRPIGINVRMRGMEALRNSRAEVDQLAESFRRIGMSKVGDQLEAGVITAGEAASAAKMRVRELSREYETLVGKSANFEKAWAGLDREPLIGFTDKLAEARAQLDAVKGERAAIGAQLAEARHVEGMATGISGHEPGVINEAARAEKNLRDQARPTAEALEFQREIVVQKMAALAELNTQTRAFVVNEENMARASRSSSAAMAEGEAEGVLRRRALYNRAGGKIGESTTRQGGIGEEITESEHGAIRNISAIEQWKAKFQELRAEYQGSREDLMGMGFGPGSAEQLERMGRYIEERRAMLGVVDKNTGAPPAQDSMHGQNLGNSALYRQQLAEVNTLAAAHKQSELSAESRADRLHAIGIREMEAEAEKTRMIQKQYEDRLAAERAALIEQQRIEDMAARHRAAFAPLGSKRVTETEGPSGRTRATVSEQEIGGMKQVVQLTEQWDHSGKLLGTTLKNVTGEMEKQGSVLGRTIINNIRNAGQFILAYATVGAAIGAVSAGVDSMVNLERHTAILKQVFRGTHEEATALAYSVLQLAAANGRSSEEAIDSATRFARLGLNQVEIVEAVGVAMQAANVTQLTAAETAEHLSAIYAAYGLRVRELRTVLNELNTISNTYNVTSKDLLEGVARVSGIAKQAGVSLSELFGIIGTGVGRTGRSGTEIANAIKRAMVSVSKEKVQSSLAEDFGVQVKTPTGELKNFSTILNELYLRYIALNNAQQASLLQMVGGTQQASRLASVMDGYVMTQVLAIRAQEDLTSADRENVLIRETMSSQLRTLATEWELLFVKMSQTGGSFSIVSVLGEAIKTISSVMHLMSAFPTAALVMITVLTVIGVKMLLMAGAQQKVGESGNILKNTVAQLRDMYATFNAQLDATNAKLMEQKGLLGSVARAAGGVKLSSPAGAAGMTAAQLATREAEVAGGVSRMGGLTKFAMMGAESVGAFAVGLLEMIPWILAATVAMWGIQKAAEYFTSDTDKATKKLADMNKELERYHSLAGAAQMKERLAKTLQEAIPVLAKKNPNDADRALSDFASIVSPDTKEQSRIEGELLLLRRKGDIAGVQAKLGEVATASAAQMRDYSHQELATHLKVLDAQRQQLRVLDQKIERQKQLGKDVGDLTAERSKKLQEINETGGAARKSYHDSYEDDETVREQNYEETAAQKAMKDRFKSNETEFDKTAKGYGTAGEGDVSKVQQEIAFLKQRRDMIEQVRMAVKREGDESVAAAQRRVDMAPVEAHALKERMDSQLETQHRKSSMLRGQMMESFSHWGTPEGKEESRRLESEWKQSVKIEEMMRSNRDAIVTGKRPGNDDKIARLKEATAEMEKAALATDLGTGSSEDEGKKKQAVYDMLSPDQKKEFDRLDPSGKSQRGVLTSLANRDMNVLASDRTGTKEQLEEYDASRAALEKSGDVMKRNNSEAEKQAKAAREAADEEKRRLDIAIQYARIREAAEEGTKTGKREVLEFQVGRNETEKALAEIKALGGQKGGLIGDAVSRNENAVTKEDQARTANEAIALGQRLTHDRNALLDRQKQIIAEIANEERRRNEEASKSLLMAGQEDQLRAAMLARYTKSHGSFTAAQFQFLSPEIKQSADKFSPDSLPPEIPSRLNELKKEQELLEKNLGGLSAAVERTTKWIDEHLKEPAYPSADKTGQPPAPQIQSPGITFNFAEQYREMTEMTAQIVRTGLDAQLMEMRSTLAQFTASQRLQFSAAVNNNIGA